MKKLLIILQVAIDIIIIVFGVYFIKELKNENLILRQQDFTLATAFNQLSSRVTVIENVPKTVKK